MAVTDVLGGGAVTLTRRLANGDVSALAELYDRYADPLHDFAFSVLRDGDQAADVVHDVLLVARHHAGELRDAERLEGWLFALARADVLQRKVGTAAMAVAPGLDVEEEEEEEEVAAEEPVAEVEEPTIVTPPPVIVEIPPLPGSEPEPEAADETEPEAKEEEEEAESAPETAAEEEPITVPVPPVTSWDQARLDEERDREAVWLDAATLPARTRVVLDLSLRQNLSGRTLADALGVRPPQVDSLVEREQQRAVSDLGALAVARSNDGECPNVGHIETRGQIINHVNRCEICSERRRSIPILALLAGVPRVPAPTELYGEVLADHDADVPPPVPLGPDGFPRGRPVRTIVALALAVAVLIALVAVAISVGSDDDDEPVLAIVSTTVARPTTTVTTASTTLATAVTTTVPATTVVTTAPTVAAAAPPGTVPFSVDTPSISFGSGGSSAPLVLRATGGSDVSWRTSSPVSWLQVQPTSGSLRAGTRSTPTVQLLRVRAPEGDVGTRLTVTASSGGATRTFSVPVSAMIERPPAVAAAINPNVLSERGCGGTEEAAVGASISEESGLSSVAVRWTHSDGTSGERAMALRPDGVWEGTLGPYRRAGDAQWQVVATDGRGNVGASDPQILTVAGC